MFLETLPKVVQVAPVRMVQVGQNNQIEELLPVKKA